MDDEFADFDNASTGSDPAAESEELAWRETYYVLFQHSHRPTLTQVEAAVLDADKRLKVEKLQANEDGLFQSMLIHAPEDNAALEVSFEGGEAVIEQSGELAKSLIDNVDGEVLAELLRADARLDVMHFERINETTYFEVDDDADSMMVEALDPATLITVIEALANLTEGLAIDPAAGELLI